MKYMRHDSWIGRLFVLSGLAVFLAAGSHALAVGAATPFTTLEAEDGTESSGATVVSWVVPATPPTVSSPEMEASGRSYVKLSATGQTISWTNPVANANGLNIRFMIPDGATGGGTTATLDLYVNGSFVQPITMNSGQAWVYETTLTSNGLNDAPGTGLSPHFFWDETHVMLAAPIPSGATIALKKDSTNTAAYYGIDCIDLEVTGAAKPQPTNSISITASPYNAVSGGTVDCTAAIQSCINAAAAASPVKSVWIPSGKYLITGPIAATNVTIAGAGMWYSEIYKAPNGTNRTSINMTGGTIPGPLHRHQLEDPGHRRRRRLRHPGRRHRPDGAARLAAAYRGRDLDGGHELDRAVLPHRQHLGRRHQPEQRQRLRREQPHGAGQLHPGHRRRRHRGLLLQSERHRHHNRHRVGRP